MVLVQAIAVAAESKREEEKAKGVNPEDGAQNPDIVPFEDNEEEEEEESEEEEEGSGQALSAAQGRGRGRGAMWTPHIPLAHGGRPMPGGVRGFPPVMMGADGFGYGGVTPDLYGVGPRAFGPYGHMGPRFPGNFSGMNQSFPLDGTGPAPGLMFHGRPTPVAVFPPGGHGMMMGAGRAPFVGGMGMVGPAPSQANRPIGPPSFRPLPPPPSHNTGRMVRRDQRVSGSDRNDRYTPDSDRDKRQEMVPPNDVADEMKYPQASNAHHGDSFGTGNSFRNEESESEDEAPRRSRHGEGKKKRRGSEEETASDHVGDAID